LAECHKRKRSAGRVFAWLCAKLPLPLRSDMRLDAKTNIFSCSSSRRTLVVCLTVRRCWFQKGSPKTVRSCGPDSRMMSDPYKRRFISGSTKNLDERFVADSQ
jgi:hypothetical protein